MIRPAALLLSCLALAGCAGPDRPGPTAVETVCISVGLCSAPDMVADFARWDADLRAAGKLRAERAPIDAPYTREDLAHNFAKIGFGSEFEIVDGGYSPLDSNAEAPLTRWGGPIRYAPFGDFDAADTAAIDGFAERLADVTRLDIGPAGREPNLLVFFLDARGRRQVSELFAEEPDYRPLADLFEAWAADPKWPCAAEFYYHAPTSDRAHEIYFAVVYIRTEVTGISRRSCIEEEIAQTLGLARDDPSLRPSIFNDDEEFALMTEHDAALLRLLYDPRLEPGMTAAEAMPIVHRILGAE
ncbi:DUF2927 domain-containing protein [Paralimibaculum aggregatum]|uniref:DUF2927 domain-containing protein n=1 Tax=Paralimibaculum aggregatum TaxID=3036245 RepID=A0ABQ6LFW9_9RHOB|nr:DUF2927 domain-containing protein [Limibaculum sp. NKW23]GMG81882.1 DUF2927 domain-containing protein [Limibaculum sp. NKW23]